MELFQSYGAYCLSLQVLDQKDFDVAKELNKFSFSDIYVTMLTLDGFGRRS